MTDAHATVKRRRGVNPVWLVPIVAVVLGIWMLIVTIQGQGPTISIVFKTAEGIKEDKTKIKLYNVDIGIVEEVRLGEDLETVVITALLKPEAEPLLRDDTQFWVVRPRIGKGGVSGLSTLLSGGYIQLAPGGGAVGRTEFDGLEEPPVTPAGTPGIRVVLYAEKAGSIGPGDPVLYKGYRVGRVESESFEIETQRMHYDVFIDAPYSEELTLRHRFWDVSGVSATVSAEGIEVKTASMETLLFGGVEVGLPTGVADDGLPVDPGELFRVYDNFADVNQHPYRHSMEYVVAFSQSVRGLRPGASVEYRGLKVGEVERIMKTEMAGSERGQGQPIPVLLRMEPARAEQADSPAGLESMRAMLETAVPGGLHATLASGNILSGALYVSMDFYRNIEPGEIGIFAGRPTIPTLTSGLEGIQQKLTMFLDKLNKLQLEGTVVEAQNTLASINRLVAGERMQTLPVEFDKTLRELQATLASFSADSELQMRLLPTITELELSLTSLRQLLSTLERTPNALIFNAEYQDDPRPSAGSQ